jgi:hypothetical protein
MALAYLQTCDLAHAADFAGRAVKAAQAMQNRIEEVDALRIHGTVLAAQRNGSQAAGLFEEALTLSRIMSYPYAEAQTLREWGRLSLQDGESERARQQLGAAADIFRRLGARRDLADTESLLQESCDANLRLDGRRE